MVERRRFFKVTGPRVEGPKLRGPHFKGGKLHGPRIEGPHFKGPRINLTRRGRVVLASAGVLTALVVIGENSGHNNTQSTDTNPGVSSSSGQNSIPEAFQVGRHTLTSEGEELAANGVTFNRVYKGSQPTDTWYVAFKPDFPNFKDGKKVPDPYIRGVDCKLENAGVKIIKKPLLVCDFTGNKGPTQKPFRHHEQAKK